MKVNIKSRLKKQEILTIPNILSFFRILLIPAIAVSYVKNHICLSVSLILLSGATDILDGWIARKFNMISDFGKFLDPVADKLTQITMLLCLVSTNLWILILVGLLVVKEIFQFVYGLIVLKKTDTMNSAKWFGKVTTVVIYASMIFLFLVKDPSPIVFGIVIAICGFVMLCSMILYGRFFHGFLRETTQLHTEVPKSDPTKNDTASEQAD